MEKDESLAMLVVSIRWHNSLETALLTLCDASTQSDLITGLYYKLHHMHRPVNMKKPTIKRRKRIPAAPPAQVSAA